MFKSPVQPTSVRPAVRASVRFGCPVQTFRDVFDRKELNKYGDVTDIEERYKLLPESMKTVVDDIFDGHKVCQDDVQRYYDQGRLGLLEECADVLFEYQMYRAAVDGVIGEGQIFSWVQPLKKLRSSGKPFPAMGDYIRKAIRPEQYDRFQELLGMSDRALSDELFAVSSMKPAQFAMKGKHDVLVANTRHHFRKEAEELVEMFEGKPLLQRVMKLYVGLMIPLEPILGQYMSWFPRQVVRVALGLKTLKRRDLANYVIIKQTGRQDLDYSSELKYDQRKMVLKPFEALVEASVLKQLEQA